MAKRKITPPEEKKAENGPTGVKANRTKITTPVDESESKWTRILRHGWNAIGVMVGLAFAKHHAWFCYQQHENEMWFSNIKEVEREISFRTESGLYYSYFKQTVQAMFVKIYFFDSCYCRYRGCPGKRF